MITSAHCADGQNPSDMVVDVGDTVLATEMESFSAYIEVAEIIQHPNFNKTFSNNIAIIVLDQTVPLDVYPNIKPACLPGALESFSYYDAVISGFGWHIYVTKKGLLIDLW